MGQQTLSAMAQLFCAYYVANGGNGTQAAISAGYARSSAAVQASKLLARPEIKAQIALIRSGHLPTLAAGGNGGDSPPLDGQILDAHHPGPHPHGKRRMDAQEELNRDRIIDGLWRVFGIAIGDEMVEIAVVAKGTKTVDGQGSTETVEAVRVKVSALNLTAANGALKQLSEQLDIIGKLGGKVNPTAQQFLDQQYADKIAEMATHLPAEDASVAA